MFDPGGVLHAALRAALRRSQECSRGEWSLDKLGMISPPQSPLFALSASLQGCFTIGFGGQKRESEPIRA